MKPVKKPKKSSSSKVIKVRDKKSRTPPADKLFYQAKAYLQTGVVSVQKAATTFGLSVKQFGAWLQNNDKKFFDKHFESY